MNWWNKQVIYQIYPRTFKDSDGSGLGDINGITQKLPYLKNLGIGAIWICPFYKSPMVDNGYDVSDYYEVDPMFGTNNDLDKLLSKAQALDIKIILDIVMNHTSNQHEWFQKALQGDPKYRDYYIFASEPGVEKSAFGGSAWTYVAPLGQYYFHSHAPEQPDLNWTNPAVHAEFIKVLDFWVEKGVRGFRFDVVDLIGKVIKVNPTSITYDNSITHALLKKINASSKIGNAEILKVGETVKFDINDVTRASTPDEHELSMAFLFNHQGIDKHPELRGWKPQPFSLVKLKQVLKKMQDDFDKQGWNSIFWNNHDGPRIVSRWGDTSSEASWKASAKLIFTVGALLKGTLYIYQGEELGMTNHHFENIDQFQDLDTIGKYKVLVEREKKLSNDEFIAAANRMSREHGRTAMQWSSGAGGGFSDHSKVIVNDDYLHVNVNDELLDESSILNYCKQMIAFRNDNQDFLASAHLEFDENYANSDQIIAFWRTEGKNQYRVVANWSNTPAAFDWGPEADYEIIIGNLGNADASQNFLKPWQVFVMRNKEK